MARIHKGDSILNFMIFSQPWRGFADLHVALWFGPHDSGEVCQSHHGFPGQLHYNPSLHIDVFFVVGSVIHARCSTQTWCHFPTIPLWKCSSIFVFVPLQSNILDHSSLYVIKKCIKTRTHSLEKHLWKDNKSKLRGGPSPICSAADSMYQEIQPKDSWHGITCKCRWLQQLCRDWSKSGKRVDAASAMKHNSSDSNSNDRSSSTSR